MLYNFLVLGYIPGTDIQLSFQAVLGLVVIFAGATVIAWIEVRRRWLGMEPTMFAGTTDASQLHLREQ